MNLLKKWERDLSFPDVNTLPKLAEIFNVTVDELMQTKKDTKESATGNKVSEKRRLNKKTGDM